MAQPIVAPSPELRALLAYDTRPTGCLAVPVTKDCLAPHLRPGEFAIVDPTDRELQHGEFYLVAWMGRPDDQGNERCALVQAYQREHHGLADGGPRHRVLWSVGSLRKQRSAAEADRLFLAGRWRELGWSNGPYVEGALEEQVRGRVVGLLASSFEEPKRVAVALCLAIGGARLAGLTGAPIRPRHH